jgi:hypothetical protein
MLTCSYRRNPRVLPKYQLQSSRMNQKTALRSPRLSRTLVGRSFPQTAMSSCSTSPFLASSICGVVYRQDCRSKIPALLRRLKTSRLPPQCQAEHLMNPRLSTTRGKERGPVDGGFVQGMRLSTQVTMRMTENIEM